MAHWCKDCARNQDGYSHLKCENCKWFLGGEDFKWDRFIPVNDTARHPSSFFPAETKKESGLIHRIFGFIKG